ncbi:MAG: hypothetical protein NZ533_03560 [Casimicrobiaceae bacterium]|nr:hypothetical protein [Casimicrobiaceae bacterium]MCX8098294.1 hypothetical protein [Casimicrobiaceae bacterium]MDW8311769.1 hypothetical protein [Burkholderiales bacterium]
MLAGGFWIVLLEALVAGALFVGLIIWVMRSPPPSERARFEQVGKPERDSGHGEHDEDRKASGR